MGNQLTRELGLKGCPAIYISLNKHTFSWQRAYEETYHRLLILDVLSYIPHPSADDDDDDALEIRKTPHITTRPRQGLVFEITYMGRLTWVRDL